MALPLVLIVDDEKSTREGLRMALEDDFEIFLAASIAEAKIVLENESIDAILTDLRLSGESGMDVLELAKNCAKPPICIIMTAYGSIETAVNAMKRGAWSFVTKPLNLDEVELMLKRAIKTRSLETENKELNLQLQKSTGLDKLLGKSQAMEKIFQQIRQIAPTSATVLIEGESGTGKELVAQALHSLSGRPASKFVIVNCAALAPQLLESELFGHEKGSFTGAMSRRIGRFEQADGGTILLDEIGEIDATTQVKLLRALSERTIERVGSSQPIKINVRVISATNKNLASLVQQGKFREDLFYRLNVVKIQMPPLRDRKEDIPLLAQAFLKEFIKENNRTNIHSFSRDAQKLLRDYDWPGNVRQLRTAVEHGVVMAQSDQITPEDLPETIQNKTYLLENTSPLEQKIASQQNFRLEERSDFNLSRLETTTIEAALRHAKGNISQAAILLGISRRTLQRKLASPHFTE